MGSRVVSLDGSAVVSGRGLVRRLIARAPGEQVTLGVATGDRVSDVTVKLLDEGRRTTCISIPILAIYDAAPDRSREEFVAIDLYVVSPSGTPVRWRREALELPALLPVRQRRRRARRMIAAALLMTAALGPAGDTSYVDASVRVDGTLLDWTFVDVDEDGRDELALSARNPRGDRELHLHRVRGTCGAGALRHDPRPRRHRRVDLRRRPGRPRGKKLVLLTRQGAWSFDPRRTGYRGNIARLCEWCSCCTTS